MKKGISETFDEHERDTATRGYSNELVERAKRTAAMPKVRTAMMPKVDLDSGARSESGERPVATEDSITRHAQRASANEGALSGSVDVTAELATIAAVEPASLAPAASLTSTLRARRSRLVAIPQWTVAAALAAVMLLVSVAATVGFFVGRGTLGR